MTMFLTTTMMKMMKAWWVRSGRAANARCVTEELPCSSLTLNEEEEDSYGEEARFNNANHTHPHLGPPWMPAWGPLTRQGTHFPHSSTSCPKSPSRSPTSGDSLHPSAMCILISPAWEQSYSIHHWVVLGHICGKHWQLAYFVPHKSSLAFLQSLITQKIENVCYM